MCIIKNFEGVGTEIDGLEQFRVSWSYISLPDGTEIGPRDFAIPDNLVTEEFILGWNTTTNSPTYALAGAAVLNPIAWYNDTFFLEYYFIDADLNIKAPSLRVPKAYDDSTQYSLIRPDTLFRANGKNFPGQSALTDKTTTSNYPGLTAGLGLTPTQDNSRPSIYECLTDYFLSEMLKHEYKVRNSWETIYGPHSGSNFSLNIFGLDRSDYTFLNKINLYKDYVVSTLPSNSVIPTNNIYIVENNGALIHSLNSLSDFKYGVVNTPADLGVAIVDFSTGINTITRPINFYNADGVEGTTLFYTCNNSLQLQLNLTADRYEPTIVLDNPILATEFKRGFNYKYPITQVVFPSGFINLTPTTGKFPFISTRPYNVKEHSFGVFGGKNTKAAAEFFFKLFRLRQGSAYSVSADLITTGPQDLDPLVLWSLPTMIVQSQANNSFLADATIGTINNQISIRLPFSYKRGEAEWELAHSICQAFLQNYTIGYHEFTADFSAADEPVFLIEYEDEPIINQGYLISSNTLAVSTVYDEYIAVSSIDSVSMEEITAVSSIDPVSMEEITAVSSIDSPAVIVQIREAVVVPTTSIEISAVTPFDSINKIIILN